MGLYNYDRLLSYEERKIRESGIPAGNKELIMKFERFLLAQGVSKARIVRYLQTLRKVSEMYPKPFDEWSPEDMLEVVAIIEERYTSAETKNEYRKGLRKFFKWLKGENWEGLLYVRGEKKSNRLPQVLSEEEIMRMIEVARHPRDKALIAVGYEGGFRVSELAGIRIGDVEFMVVNGHLKAKVRVYGKTGERRIPLVMSAPILKAWLDVHPMRYDPEAVVFCSISNRKLGEPMEYRAFSRIIKILAKKAGIKKRVHPHILRHSRATVLAKYLPEAVLCEYFGWVQGSDIPAVYVHLSGRDLDEAIDRLYEIGEEEKPKVVKPRKCPRCGHVNDPTAVYCSKCALVLDEGKRIELEMMQESLSRELAEKLLANPKILEELKELVELVEKVRARPELLRSLLS